MQARRCDAILPCPPFVGAAASAAVGTWQISLAGKFGSPDVRDVSWTRGRAAACSGRSALLLIRVVVPGGPG